MKFKIQILLTAVVFYNSLSLSAPSQKKKNNTFVCPLEIHVGKKINKGVSHFQFKDQSDEVIHFKGFKVFDQDPVKKKEIKADEGSTAESMKWTFFIPEYPTKEKNLLTDDLLTSTKKISLWIQCEYGERKQQKLVQKISKLPSSCQLLPSKMDKSIYTVFECQD